MGFVRAFGLLAPDRTPCGRPLPPSDAHALTEIAAGPLTQRELAARLSLDRSTVSRLVDRLEARDWVTRRVHPESRRAVELRLTAEGVRAARELQAARTERFDALMEALPAGRRDEVVEALRQLTQASQQIGAGR